jgi:hypothetical protein
MTDTHPILERLYSMFASKANTHSTDVLQEQLFSKVVDFVERQDCFNSIAWSSIENGHSIKDAISDVYLYITNDRPLQVNKLIECELSENYDALSEHSVALEEQDTYHLSLIVSFRKIIFG